MGGWCHIRRTIPRMEDVCPWRAPSFHSVFINNLFHNIKLLFSFAFEILSLNSEHGQDERTVS
jgi:hypothetical protein